MFASIRNWMKARAIERRQRVYTFIYKYPGKNGLQISKATRLSVGHVYPILYRLEEDGLIRGEWGIPSRKDGPRPRYYFPK